jgi:hypothetical protein
MRTSASFITWRTALQMLRTIAIGGLLAITTSGCATEHERYAQDGRKAYALNWSGMARGLDKCFSAAGNFCGASGASYCLT